MYFGGSSFAAAPFGSSGGISIRAAVTGSRVNLSSGSPVIIGKALVVVSGSRINATIGNADVEANAVVSVTGSRTNLDTSSVLIRKWYGIVPGVSMTWDSATFPEKRA